MGQLGDVRCHTWDVGSVEDVHAIVLRVVILDRPVLVLILSGLIATVFRGIVAEQFIKELVDLVGVDGDDGFAHVTDPVDGGHGDGLELHVAAGQVLHLGCQGHDVPALVQNHGALHGVVDAV